MQPVRVALIFVAMAAFARPSVVGAQSAQAVPAPATAAANSGSEAVVKTEQPVQTPLKPAAKPPAKVGFARVAPDWPTWLTLTLVDRMRIDSMPLPGSLGGPYDNYLLNRFRVTAGLRFAPWGQATVQGQDARVFDFDAAIPKSARHMLDLRLAYVDLGKKRARGATAAIGRQELTFGDGRLMATADWGNVGRTYDAVRLAVFVPGVKLEVFGAAPVDVTTSAQVSVPKYGERVAGAWSTFDKVKPLGYLEIYEVAKLNRSATGETGTTGDQRVYATGLRAGGPIGKTVSWEAESVFERGHSARDSIAAWALHAGGSWTVGKSAWKPKVGGEYNFASGDRNPKDGVKGTFDQMYASTHAKWGLGDLVGWRNMHQAAAKVEISPARRLKVNAAVNKLMIAERADSWYGASGAKLVTNRAATSRDLGWEPDIFGSFTLTPDITIGAGYAVLFGGDYVRQSTKYRRIRTPYLTWTVKF